MGYIVNQSLVALYDTGSSSLVFCDIHNVDKQDDGAAQRVFHHQALEATTVKEDNGECKIHDGFCLPLCTWYMPFRVYALAISDEQIQVLCLMPG